MSPQTGRDLAPPVAPEREAGTPGIAVRDLGLNLQGKAVLRGVSFGLPAAGLTSLIGPSGAGKSSLLRCLNGLYTHWTGDIAIAGRPARRWPGGWDALRRHVGLIAQTPCFFPRSIYDNVVFGLKGAWRRRRAGALAEECLRRAALWDEVKDRLHRPAGELSTGQQQRLCLARALAVHPRILLLDEPTAALDPHSKQLIERTLASLAQRMPVLCATHDLAQAQRLGGRVIFLCDGRLIEQGESAAFFARPQRLESREFLRWTVCDCAGD